MNIKPNPDLARDAPVPAWKRYGITNLGVLIGKRARIEGFLVSDYAERFDSARRWISERLQAGDLKQRLHVIEGLDRAPEGLRMLFQGENTGKTGGAGGRVGPRMF